MGPAPARELTPMAMPASGTGQDLCSQNLPSLSAKTGRQRSRRSVVQVFPVVSGNRDPAHRGFGTRRPLTPEQAEAQQAQAGTHQRK